MRRPRTMPAYKARLAARAARLEELREVQAHIAFANWTAEFVRKQWAEHDAEMAAREARRQAEREAQDARAKARRPSLFAWLFSAATQTTDRLAQDFKPKKGAGDARFFA